MRRASDAVTTSSSLGKKSRFGATTQCPESNADQALRKKSAATGPDPERTNGGSHGMSETRRLAPVELRHSLAASKS